MKYTELIEQLRSYAEADFATFQRKLIFTKQKILGVRTPILRKLSKRFITKTEEVLDFPDDYYEVTFIKILTVSALKYEQFILYVEKCVSLMDNWATCDCFKAKCIDTHKDEFLSILERLFVQEKEYYVRFVLVMLLTYYVEEKYLSLIANYIFRADTTSYYVHMAVAWLTAEILVKHYDFGIVLLQSQKLNAKTHNKAIQKAIESYRIDNEQKEYLRSLKIKTKR